MLTCEKPASLVVLPNHQFNCRNILISTRVGYHSALLQSHSNACRVWPMLNGCAGAKAPI